MKQSEKPKLVVIAGPNGAGKSTLTSQYPELIKDTVFINPDEIAKEMATSYPEKTDAQHQVMAGRKALESYESCFEKKQSFSLETTLAGNTPLRTMKKAQENGYNVTLCYVGINSPYYSIDRVRDRVQEGGHNVPIDDILRRYDRSMENLPHALALSDAAFIYDNSQSAHVLHLFLEKGHVKEIYDAQQPEWLKQRIVETSLEKNQKLIFKQEQELVNSTTAIKAINDLSKETKELLGLYLEQGVIFKESMAQKIANMGENPTLQKEFAQLSREARQNMLSLANELAKKEDFKSLHAQLTQENQHDILEAKQMTPDEAIAKLNNQTLSPQETMSLFKQIHSNVAELQQAKTQSLSLDENQGHSY